MPPSSGRTTCGSGPKLVKFENASTPKASPLTVVPGATGGVAGSQFTSLCADATITSPDAGKSRMMWIMLTVSADVLTPSPLGTNSFRITSPTPGTKICVFGAGVTLPSATPSTTRFVNAEPAPVLDAIVPSHVLLDSASTRSAVTVPPNRSTVSTVVLVCDDAVVMVVEPLVVDIKVAVLA